VIRADSMSENNWLDKIPMGNKLVYSTTNFIKFPLNEALERIAAGRFRNVELWGNLKHLDPRNEAEDVRLVAESARRLGLRIVSIHAPFTLSQPGTPDERMTAWRELMGKSFEHADYLGCRQIVVHPVTAGTDDSDSQYRDIVARTEDSLVKLAGLAEGYGLRLAVENMPGHRNRRYGRSVGELHEFVVRSGCSNLGLCMDTGHVIFNNGDVVREFTACADRVFSIHLNDNIWGMHMDLHLVPGFGSVDWESFHSALAEEKYSGMIVLELDGRGRPSSIFSEAQGFARKFFGVSGASAGTTTEEVISKHREKKQ
jgi:sugar phosphate isomerase/epimerase